LVLENAKNSEIPHNYLLITNNEIVRVRYLFVYGSNKPTIKLSSTSGNESASINEVGTSGNAFLNWCRRNPLFVAGALYVILLMLVGLNNNRYVEHYKRIIGDFFNKRFKFE
jgi:hypothetical protein